MAVAVVTSALCVSCGRSNSSADTGSPNSCELDGFADDVRAAREANPNLSDCIAPLPPTEAYDEGAALEGVRAFIASVRGVPADSLEVSLPECSLDRGSCASHFLHGVYGCNSSLANALEPMAEELERCSLGVEHSSWVSTVDGIQSAAVSGLSGRWEDRLIGMVFFGDFNACP